MSYPPEQLIAKYLVLRDQKEKLEDRHKLELMPIKEAINVIENVLGVMIAQLPKGPKEAKNIKTEVGTAYNKEIISITTLDLAAFTNFAIDNDPAMLHIKPSETGVPQYIEKQTKQQSKLAENERKPIIIPGIKVERFNKTVVRKA